MAQPKQSGNRSGNNPRGNSNSRGSRPKKDGLKSAKARPKTTAQARNASRGEAIRASRRNMEDANRMASKYLTAAQSEGNAKRANFIDNSARLKVIEIFVQ